MARTTNKQKKKKARERRLSKERNIRKNMAEVKFYLMVDFADDEGWKRMMNFKNKDQVQTYLRETQEIRDKGDVRIFEGVIYDKFDVERYRIPSYDPPEGVSPEAASEGAGSVDLEAAKGD